jgi:DNA-binding transcriptional LysR family regulator
VLSKYGVEFLGYVEKAMDKLSEGKETIAQMVDPLRGNIKLGYIYSLSFDFLPYVIDQFYSDITNTKILLISLNIKIRKSQKTFGRHH